MDAPVIVQKGSTSSSTRTSKATIPPKISALSQIHCFFEFGRRVLLITSPFCIRNSTAIPMQVSFVQTQRKHPPAASVNIVLHEQYIPPHGWYNVTLQLMDSSIQMTPSSSSKRQGYALFIHWKHPRPSSSKIYRRGQEYPAVVWRVGVQRSRVCSGRRQSSIERDVYIGNGNDVQSAEEEDDAGTDSETGSLHSAHPSQARDGALISLTQLSSFGMDFDFDDDLLLELIDTYCRHHFQTVHHHEELPPSTTHIQFDKSPLLGRSEIHTQLSFRHSLTPFAESKVLSGNESQPFAFSQNRILIPLQARFTSNKVCITMVDIFTNAFEETIDTVFFCPQAGHKRQLSICAEFDNSHVTLSCTHDSPISTALIPIGREITAQTATLVKDNKACDVAMSMEEGKKEFLNSTVITVSPLFFVQNSKLCHSSPLATAIHFTHSLHTPYVVSHISIEEIGLDFFEGATYQKISASVKELQLDNDQRLPMYPVVLGQTETSFVDNNGKQTSYPEAQPVVSVWFILTLLDDQSVDYVSVFGTLVHQLELLAEEKFVMSLMRVVASQLVCQRGSPPIPATIGLTPERDLVFYFEDFVIQPICVVATINLMEGSYSRREGDALQRLLHHKPHRQVCSFFFSSSSSLYMPQLVSSIVSHFKSQLKQDVKRMYYDPKDASLISGGLSGIWGGVAGLLKHSTIGHHGQSLAQGFKALGKDIATGLVGTVVKPVVGTVDHATKTIDEVKYASTIFDQKRRGRVRAPRWIGRCVSVLT
ncbi:hypothetical protein BLNAU_22683 [Blattamonas nauphoetae]|uniref:Vacuolar protein sorting-associated protein 13 DH-like domain-containing protein n=1 Tax=Blattamonas nauphoetae TaxID=2049346 RepID=A0ABQ9WSC0_9EUKA|nr:hypothetical protein BLNAU_22683 [Blattamonas nauphoetae]